MASLSEQAKLIADGLLPEKSKDKYIQVYNSFIKWKEENKIDENFSEDVMLVYFGYLKGRYAPSSLWCFHSMLRTAVERNNNINIDYPKLRTLLKKEFAGYNAQKSKVFQPEEISKFLCEAPNSDYLATKVIMILGIYGTTRSEELTRMDLKDISEQSEVLIVKIPLTKTKITRTFTLEDEYAAYVEKYMELRSYITSTSRFLMNFQKGKCANQPIGKNKILSTPKVIAKFLNLAESEKYTGHSFRRTSATLLADAGADLLTLKRHGGWRSSSAAEGYVEESVNNKRKIGNLIAGQVNLQAHKASTSSFTSLSSVATSSETTAESVIRSQSVVSIIRSSSQTVCAPHHVGVEPVISDAQLVNPVAVQASKGKEMQHMQLNNCEVKIYFKE